MSVHYGIPSDEAIQLLDAVVKECTLGDPDVKMVLRRCMYAAHLIGDSDNERLFHYHINGFPKDAEIPTSRRISGTIHWKTEKSIARVHDSDGETADARLGTPAAEVFEARSSIERLQDRASSGLYRSSTTVEPNEISVRRYQHRVGYSPHSYVADVPVYPWDVYPAYNFKYALGRIRQDAFTWAMTTVVRLKYQNRIAGIWEVYRAEVDKTLAQIQLTNHLAALDRQLGSGNEQEWRSALYSCRNMLRDVADYLWGPSSDTVKLPDKNGAMKEVHAHKEKYIVRLNAYLYYKSNSNDQSRLARTEAEFLGELIGRVNALDNNAHEKVDRSVAEAAALHTYMVISNLIRLTDMAPLKEFSL